MRDVSLDLTPFSEMISLHTYLKEALGFPFYYGANLDALHDELTSETSELHIHVRYPACPQGKMETYLPRLLQVFSDSEKENYHLKIELEEAE